MTDATERQDKWDKCWQDWQERGVPCTETCSAAPSAGTRSASNHPWRQAKKDPKEEHEATYMLDRNEKQWTPVKLGARECAKSGNSGKTTVQLPDVKTPQPSEPPAAVHPAAKAREWPPGITGDDLQARLKAVRQAKHAWG